MIYFVETPANRQRVVLCQWVERFHEEGKTIHIVAESSLTAQHLDQLLWSFSDLSFIPHRIHDLRSRWDGREPVVITVGEGVLEAFQVLVCDAWTHLDFMKRYPEAVHFVLTDDDEMRQQSRLMWMAAREQGLDLRHVPFSTSRR